MTMPQTNEDVQRFVGFATYLSKFCPKPQREVLRKNSQFFLEEPQQEAFRKVKELATQAPVLNLFDPGKYITLTVGASSTSLGAALLQDGVLVEYAAKALTLGAALLQDGGPVEYAAKALTLGAALLQDGGIVEYAAKALTWAQINYAQLKKELQAIVFGCERFLSNIYGREVTVKTDN